MNEAILLKFYKCIFKKNNKKSNIKLASSRNLKKNRKRKSNLNLISTQNFKKHIKQKSNINLISTRNLKKNIKQKSNINIVPTRKLNTNIKQKSDVNLISIQNLKKNINPEYIEKSNSINMNKNYSENKSIKTLIKISKNKNLSDKLLQKNLVIQKRKIIGYIHICQKGDWKRSFKLLLDSIINYKLYENTCIIRLGIVNDEDKIIDDEILKDEKFECLYFGKSTQYERPTLLHMRQKSETEDNTAYYYLHTKGITHFNTDKEPFVIDWINLMLYWNIECWELAYEKLLIYSTYGCNNTGYHYSGNFWWATNDHIKKLPTYIADYYTAPENWIQTIKNNKYCVFKSGYQGMGHYKNLYPRDKYVKTITV
jgi:hypothetical protein